MTEPTGKPNDLVHALEHPVETVEELAAEAEEGSSARTPAILLGGVTLVVGVAVAGLLLVALLVYYLV